ncbi:MAG: hypothetical protein GNW80_16530 [Asgard group archaeon]|nr:hypothetical protein [Asgard group archaeon]
MEESIFYVTYGRERLLVLNNSNYERLQLLGSLVLSDYNRAPLTKYDNYLFLYRTESNFPDTPDYFYYLEIVDVSDHGNPQLIVELQLPDGYPVSFFDLYIHEFVEIENDLYLFLKDEDKNRFLVINCTNMHQPTILDSYQFPGEVRTDYEKLHKFFIRDKTVFIPTLNATDSFGITVYNITSLTDFTKIGEWFGNNSLETFDSVYVTEDYLYLKDTRYGVEAFNIQNLTHPTRIGFVTDFGARFFCHKNYVLELGFYFFNIYDCSLTNFTVPINNYTYPDIAYTFIHYSFFDESKITDNYFYLPFTIHKPKNETLHIWDWSDPYNLTIKAKLGMPTIPSLRELSWTYKKIITPIIIGDVLTATIGIFLLRRIKVKKKE